MGSCQCTDSPRNTIVRSTLNINELLYRSSACSVNGNTILNKTQSINIKALTWNKDSHNLFDYENKNIAVQNFQIESEGYLIRKQNSIIFSVKLSQEQQVVDQLIHLVIIDNCFWIDFKTPNQINSKVEIRTSKLMEVFNEEFPQLQTLENDEIHTPRSDKEEEEEQLDPKIRLQNKVMKLWIVVKSTQNSQNLKGLKIGEGDVIRMGRAKIILQELHIPKKIISSLEVKQSSTRGSFKSDILEDQCRLCLSSTETSDNPLINPCRCQGSMEYIHLYCLQTWINTKQNLSPNAHTISFFWNTMKCELCKTHFRRIFECNGTTYDLVDLSKPKDCAYAIFDMKRKFQEKDQDNFFNQASTYIVSFKKQKDIKVGRSTESHLRISDISVSRYHAKLSLSDDGLFLWDNNSKFGTLVQLRNTIPIIQEMHRLQIQVGRSVLEFSTVKPQPVLQFSYSALHKLM